MRQKTDKKKQQLLQIATKLFLQHGFESVSMSKIAAEVGGSKSTLYNYFQNKEELFLEVALAIIQKMTKNTLSTIDPSLSLFEKLRILGINLLKFALSDDGIALRRSVFVFPNIGTKGRDIYDRAMRSVLGDMTELIETAISDGILIKNDPWCAARQLLSLFELDLVNRRLLYIDKCIDIKKIEQCVDQGLAIFGSYYSVKS